MLAHSTGRVNTWTVERRHQDGIEVAPLARNVEPYELLPYFRGIVGRAMAGTCDNFWRASHHGWFGWLVGWLVGCFLSFWGVGGILKVFNFFRISKFYQLPKRRVPTKEPGFLRKNINKQKSLNSPSEVRRFSHFSEASDVDSQQLPFSIPILKKWGAERGTSDAWSAKSSRYSSAPTCYGRRNRKTCDLGCKAFNMAFRRARKYPLDSSSLGRLLDGMTDLKLEGLSTRCSLLNTYQRPFRISAGQKELAKRGRFFFLRGFGTTRTGCLLYELICSNRFVLNLSYFGIHCFFLPYFSCLILFEFWNCLSRTKANLSHAMQTWGGSCRFSSQFRRGARCTHCCSCYDLHIFAMFLACVTRHVSLEG